MLTSSCSLAAFSAPAPCSLFFPSCPSAIMPSGACSPFSLRPLSCAARCPEPSESPAVPGLPRSTPSSPPSSPCTRASFPWWHWPAASHKSCSRRSSSAVRAWTPCLPSRWSAGCTIAPKVSTSASARTTTTTTTRSLIATITWTPTSKTTLFFHVGEDPVVAMDGMAAETLGRKLDDEPSATPNPTPPAAWEPPTGPTPKLAVSSEPMPKALPRWKRPLADTNSVALNTKARCARLSRGLRHVATWCLAAWLLFALLTLAYAVDVARRSARLVAAAGVGHLYAIPYLGPKAITV
mmetsp:Transcript_20423/g.41768  ORF Transcript_20423/g.41768 Transcript_20423/m.41768 type:complete len:295 (+) Transcript_20423:221-1105(+)